ncbi:SRPBCC family protein [Peribacillus butanolivorans]|uniref:hypothetical protein n=1 Tax=Peribacillus butanolivorans TaxID=421767 RepID=UPI00367C9540
MPHQIMINVPAEKVYEAITTTEGFKGWWTTDAKAEPQVESIAEFGFYNRKAIFQMHMICLNQVSW